VSVDGRAKPSPSLKPQAGIAGPIGVTDPNKSQSLTHNILNVKRLLEVLSPR
jgi:hypothetical protein